MIADILHKVKAFEAEEDHPYHPRPSLSGPQRCIRYLDYYRQGYERKPFPGRFMVVLEDSTIHEMLIKDLIQKSAFTVHSEQMEVVCGYVFNNPLKGKIDGIVTDMMGVDRLLEIKALSHFGFQGIWQGEELPLDYISQTCLYARGLFDVNPDICWAILLIKNKNQGQFLEIMLYYDFIEDYCLIDQMTLSTGETKKIDQRINNIVGDAVKKFEEVETYAQTKKLHNRQYDQDDWHCSYCQFGQVCWDGWEEEHEERKQNVVLGPEWIGTVKEYQRIKYEIGELTDQKDEINKKIKQVMGENDTNKATAGEYIITSQIQKRTSIDKTLIPPSMLPSVSKESVFEVIKVSKIKERSVKK